jgi:hypothetical protein
MQIEYEAPGLTDREADNLVRTIHKESSGVRAKRAQTNGRNVIHIGVLGSNSESRTITSASEWEAHPSNTKRQKHAENGNANG